MFAMSRSARIHLLVSLLALAGFACNLQTGSQPTVTPPLQASEAVPTTVPTDIPVADLTTDVATLPYRDGFDGALGPGWTWLREDPAGWSLTELNGWLRIALSTGSFFGTPPDNVLLRPAPAGDFDMRVQVMVTPESNFEFAGLLVYFSDDRVLQLGHAFSQGSPPSVGDGFYFDNIENGGAVGSNFADSTSSGSVDTLRIVRVGTSYTAYFLGQEGVWIEMGSHSVQGQPASVGLVASQALQAGLYADFDQFELLAPE